MRGWGSDRVIKSIQRLQYIKDLYFVYWQYGQLQGVSSVRRCLRSLISDLSSAKGTSAWVICLPASDKRDAKFTLRVPYSFNGCWRRIARPTAHLISLPVSHPMCGNGGIVLRTSTCVDTIRFRSGEMLKSNESLS